MQMESRNLQKHPPSCSWRAGLALVGIVIVVSALSFVVLLRSHKEPPPLPSDTITIAPAVMTYAELAEQLSTPQHRIRVHPSLQRRGVLIALKNRPLNEVKSLLERVLEVQFEYLGEQNGVHEWEIVRAPEVVQRDEALFNAYVQVVDTRIQQELRAYAPLLAQPRQQLKQRYTSLPSISSSIPVDQPVPPEELARYREELRIYWAQSLDGYAMLKWMSANWNKKLTHQLIRQRIVTFQRPLAQGIPGLTVNDVDEFLKGSPGAKNWIDLLKSRGREHDWVLGVVSWDPTTRTITPYCDFISARQGGTGWLFVPVTIFADPLSIESLFEQMGATAQAYNQQLSQHSVDFLSDPAFYTGFDVDGLCSLSQVLERWAKTFDREVLMELAPEREWLPGTLKGKHTLRFLVEGIFQESAEERGGTSKVALWDYEACDSWWPLLPYLFAVLMEAEAEGKSENTVYIEAFKRLMGAWHYSLEDGVFVARNRFAFLDRQYDYPLDALFALERSVQKHRKGYEVPPEAIAQFARHLLVEADNPDLYGIGFYRIMNWMGGAYALSVIPVFAWIEELPNAPLVFNALKHGKKTSFQAREVREGTLKRTRRLWTHNSIYASHIYCGTPSARHPNFLGFLKKAEVTIEPVSFPSFSQFPKKEGFSITVSDPDGTFMRATMFPKRWRYKP